MLGRVSFRGSWANQKVAGDSFMDWVFLEECGEMGIGEGNEPIAT